MNRHENRIAVAKARLDRARERRDTRGQHNAQERLQKATTAALRHEIANAPLKGSDGPAGDLGGLFEGVGA